MNARLYMKVNRRGGRRWGDNATAQWTHAAVLMWIAVGVLLGWGLSEWL